MARSRNEPWHRFWHSPEAWTFLATLLRVSANVVVLPLLAVMVPKAELGLWYVFLSLGAMFALLDLGFGGNLTRAAGFLWAGAPRLLAFGIETATADSREPRPPNYPQLRDLMATMGRYYQWAGFGVFAIGLLAGGGWVVLKTGGLENAVSLRCAWVVYAVAMLVSFRSGFWVALLNGINGVRRAQQAVLLAQLAYYAIVIPGLLLHGGLWALVAGNLALALATRWFAAFFFRQLAGPEMAAPGRVHWDLVKTLWPNSWRQGGTALGAYGIVQANTLICSGYLGVAATAPYGLSLQLLMVIFSLSQVWVLAQMPLINQLRAAGDPAFVATLFARRVRRFILTFWAGALALIVAGPWLLTLVQAKTTLLPREQLVVLALILFLEAHHSLYAVLVLSENYNPFLWPAILSGIGVVLASLWLTPHYGIWGMLLAQGLVQAAFNNWWPVWRAVRGLGPERTLYWKKFFALSPL